MKNRLKSLLTSVGPPLALAGGAAVLRRFQRRQRHMSLRGRSVIITGGTRDLARALATEYTRAGANVTLVARDREALQRIQEDIDRAEYHGEVAIQECNVQDRGDVKDAVEAVLDRFGRIDILVNYADVPSAAPEKGLELGTMLESYLHTTPYMTIEVAPHMIRKEEGRIVNVLSSDVSSSVTGVFDDGVRSRTIRAVSREMRRLLAPRNVYMTLAVAGPFEEEEQAGEESGTLEKLIQTDVEQAAQKIVEASRYGDTIVTTSPAVQVAEKLFSVLPYSVRSTIETVRESWVQQAREGTSVEHDPSRSTAKDRAPAASSEHESAERRAGEVHSGDVEGAEGPGAAPTSENVKEDSGSDSPGS